MSEREFIQKKAIDDHGHGPGQLLSVIVPVYNESEVIRDFYTRMKTVADSLEGLSYELVFVDDGSKDDTHQRLLNLAHADPNIRIISSPGISAIRSR